MPPSVGSCGLCHQYLASLFKPSHRCLHVTSQLSTTVKPFKLSHRCLAVTSQLSTLVKRDLHYTAVRRRISNRTTLLNVAAFPSLTTLTRHFTSVHDCVFEQNGETYIRSPYPDVKAPVLPFTEFVFSILDENKNLEHVIDNPTGRRYTGAQLKESAIKVASGLHKLGYRKGDVVLMFAANCPEYMILFMACGLLGCPISTANPVYTAGEVGKQISHCGAKCVVTTSDMLPIIRAAIAAHQDVAERVKDIITVDGAADKCRPYQTLLDDDGMSFPDNVDISPSDILVLPYSSGTTGLPKGVMLSHHNLVMNLCQGKEGQMRFRAGEDILMGLLPFYHIYGMMVLMFGSLTQAATLVILPRFEPHAFLSAIQAHRITYSHMVPPIALFLAKHPMVSDHDLSTLKTLVSAAAPLGVGVLNEVENRLSLNFIQAYGLTETSPITHYDNVPGRKGTVGQLVPSTLAKVIDPVTGKVLPQGKEGELCIKGPQVMMGYLNNQAATDDCIKDGWFQTGDISRVDEDGFFTITDRLKELIKYKGFQVAPAELEALLCTHDSIQDAAVIGLKAGEDVGEIPKAFVVAKPGVKVTEEEIEHFVKENVAPYKRLRGGVEFISEIPKTASGKILRRMLKS